MASLIYGGLDLSYERAIEIAPKAFAPAYRWFVDHTNTIGPRPYGKHQPVGIDIKLAAQRGIHKPSGQSFALSITAGNADMYQADSVHELGDGTWIMSYCMHRKNVGSKVEASAEYNRALVSCLKHGLPVGVFQKQKSGYRCLGLAFVERFDDDTELFWLHGPVKPGQGHDAFSPVTRADIDSERLRTGTKADFDSDTLRDFADIVTDEDRRQKALAEIVRRERQNRFRLELLQTYGGACAITGCDVKPALQAAHICSYLGPQSQIVTNGILLRADLHILYDNYLLSINPENMAIELSETIHTSMYRELDGRYLRLPKDRSLRPSERRLAVQYDEYLKRQEMTGA